MGRWAQAMIEEKRLGGYLNAGSELGSMHLLCSKSDRHFSSLKVPSRLSMSPRARLEAGRKVQVLSSSDNDVNAALFDESF